MAGDDLFTADELDQEKLAAQVREAREKAGSEKEAVKTVQSAPLTGRKLYIVDGYSLIYRSYFAFLTHPLTDGQWNNISAFLGFFNTVLMLIREY